ncbi:hypothetical protein BVG16_10735 [Paenibacillus selenitireducens]|uniref:Uncharacterized protein n=1 Tax=Paenibacillus selenitireducens TaxID=1324314 RepID=A0A1T2XEX2_9BACL|nr:hypothetical protein [Paenibacillus selenitireducens]OPA78352.1 hypothetical protein BVG16_10735 [Paenibacillus selenitireducens]
MSVTGRRWEPWEDEIIRNQYPTIDVEELVALFPEDRSLKRIRQRASKLGVHRISRQGSVGSGDSPEILSLFTLYLNKAIDIRNRTGRKPDVDAMLNTFREIYGRSRTGN